MRKMNAPIFQNVGIIGLGPMGCGLAQNLIKHGIDVKAWEQSPDVCNSVSHYFRENVLASSLNDLVASLSHPRCILLFLPNGQPIDDTIRQLKVQLNPGDIIADCGNSYYKETENRQKILRSSGISLIGVGVSGGPDGALSGPAIMAGGDVHSWNKIRPVFETIAAQYESSICCSYMGKAGAGHFVKMLHNGIEYGVMHLIAELHNILEHSYGLSLDEISSVFTNLNQNLTAGYLIEITAIVVNTRTALGSQSLIDFVDDAAEQKGTGRWAVEAALEFNVAIPTIAEAVMSRTLSSNRSLRREVIGVGLSSRKLSSYDKKKTEAALTLAIASTFSQGLMLLSSASESFGAQSLDRIEVLRTWRQGCILRCGMVSALIAAFEGAPNCQNVLSVGNFPEIVKVGLPALRTICADAIIGGTPVAGLSSALAYVELLNGAPWPGKIIQLQRDYFGSHGLRNRETGAIFHGPWHDDETL
jgi:6-phosphogluconate dehydrogenase